MPRDETNVCGVRPFNLPENHPFTRACGLHDYDFDESKTSGQSLLDADWSLFYRWVLIAKAEPDPAIRRKLTRDICKYWPYADRFGELFWDGK